MAFFTAEQVTQFRTQGYVAVPDFWSPQEVAAMQAEIERLKRDGLLNNVSTDGDGETRSQGQVNLQICPIYNHSDFFRAMPFAPKLIEAVSELLGDPIMLHLDQIFLKPGQHGAGTNWHQDNAYFKIRDPLKGTAAWTAAHDATIANGTIHLIPGTFNESYEHSRDPYSNHHIRCYPPEERAIPVELPAGGIVFFAYGMPHCTKGNTTEKERAGIALHFLNAEYAHDDLIDEERTTRPYLTGPQESGGLKEYGAQVAGTWNYQVERMSTSDVI